MKKYKRSSVDNMAVTSKRRKSAHPEKTEIENNEEGNADVAWMKRRVAWVNTARTEEERGAIEH